MGSFWTMLRRHAQKQPQTIPPKRSPPWPSRRNRRKTKNQSKTKISSKTLIPMAGRPNRDKKHPKIRLQKANPSWRGWQNVKLLGSKQSYQRWRCFCESDQPKHIAESAPSTACTDRAVWADFHIHCISSRWSSEYWKDRNTFSQGLSFQTFLNDSIEHECSNLRGCALWRWRTHANAWWNRGFMLGEVERAKAKAKTYWERSNGAGPMKVWSWWARWLLMQRCVLD